jgi:hypothetical protein
MNAEDIAKEIICDSDSDEDFDLSSDKELRPMRDASFRTLKMTTIQVQTQVDILQRQRKEENILCPHSQAYLAV